MRLETGIATLLCAAALPIGAQSVDPKLLLSPPADAGSPITATTPASGTAS